MSHLIIEFCYPEILNSRSAGYFNLDILPRIVAEADQIAIKTVSCALSALKPAGESY